MDASSESDGQWAPQVLGFGANAWSIAALGPWLVFPGGAPTPPLHTAGCVTAALLVVLSSFRPFLRTRLGSILALVAAPASVTLLVATHPRTPTSTVEAIIYAALAMLSCSAFFAAVARATNGKSSERAAYEAAPAEALLGDRRMRPRVLGLLAAIAIAFAWIVVVPLVGAPAIYGEAWGAAGDAANVFIVLIATALASGAIAGIFGPSLRVHRGATSTAYAWSFAAPYVITASIVAAIWLTYAWIMHA
ncbi:MAG: hypothetical protein R3A78_13885 [Polyangiales bacterium]|nr:hypothetical protein [Myxococcales bacterium]